MNVDFTQNLSPSPAMEPSTGEPFAGNALETGVDIDVPPGGTLDNPVVVKKTRFRAKPKFVFPLSVKAVLLDLDGTMLDTVGDISTAANMMRASLGFSPLDAALIRTYVG